MNYPKHKILLIEDHKSDQEAFKTLVESDNQPYDYKIAGSVSEARERLDSDKFDIVITDYLLEDGNVFDVFELLNNNVPVIVVTGEGDEAVAVKAMKAGAYDYLIKDRELNYLQVLPVTIENAIKRKKAEERLWLLESSVANANDAIIILEAEPDNLPGRRILYVNEAFTKMTGYSYEEATARTLRMLRGPKTSLSALDKIRSALEQFRPVRVELVNYRKDGSECWVECNIVPFTDEKGSFTHWVSVQRDITERKAAEEEKERLMKEIETMNTNLSELNSELETIGTERTMSLMALTVADRVRNPASMIGARCRRLLKRENTPEELKNGLTYIMEGTEKLDQIVKDFESFLKGRQTKFTHDDLNRIIESVVMVVAKDASYKDINMSVHISSEHLRINMQRDLLRVAVFHLIKNAIEAAPRGGQVKVATYKEDNEIILEVSDTGYGIPEQDVDNVFRPFFSTKEKGFGMGLPLVKQIITEHLGVLNVKSAPDRGTIFKVVFPDRWRVDNLY
jgi:PAS domain S-box-containing protein